MSSPKAVDQIIYLLAQEYGARPWQAHGEPLSVLILTILSQHTSDVNSGRSFDSLVAAFGNWQAVAAGDIEQIAESIWCGGLARVKASRIKLVLQEILERRGSLDLSFLGDLSLSEAKAWLRGLPGVGPKTVGCVLLFSLGRPVLPVDTHLYRVARRLGLIDSKVSAEQAHRLLEDMVPPADIYQFHIDMVEHGRRVCKAQRPRCPECVLREVCQISLG